MNYVAHIQSFICNMNKTVKLKIPNVINNENLELVFMTTIMTQNHMESNRIIIKRYDMEAISQPNSFEFHVQIHEIQKIECSVNSNEGSKHTKISMLNIDTQKISQQRYIYVIK
jgi:hypothetical protein